VAAHFACGDKDYKEKDGAIWCLHAGIVREMKTPRTLRTLKGVSWVYDTRLLEASFKNLRALDAAYLKEFLLLWEPPSLDARIANQHGLLSIMNGASASQTQFLDRHWKTYPDLVFRIKITASAKSKIRDMLDQNNISERTMFPGLPGLCDWLRRYYGRAW
jgi:hypothetical protein